MKKLLLYLLLSLPVLAFAQNRTINQAGNYIRTMNGTTPVDTLARVHSLVTFSNGQTMIWNSSTGKFVAYTIPFVPAGLSDSLLNKANRNFDNVAAGAIANVKLANSTISGVALGGNLAALTNGYGLSSGGTYNGSTARTFAVDTTNIASKTYLQGYAPTKAGAGATGTWPIGISGNSATVTNGVYTVGTQTIAGAKTFTADFTASANTFLNLPDYSTGTRRFVSWNTSSGLLENNTIAQMQTYLGITGGPFLPLTAGPGSPLSDDLYFNSNTRAIIFGSNSSVNPYLQAGSGNQLFFGNGGGAKYTIDGSGNNTWTGSGRFGPSASALGKFSVNDGTNINMAIKVGQTNTSAVMLNAYNDALSANIPMEFRATSYDFTVGAITGTSATLSGDVTANSFIKSGGTSSQYLMADGSVSTGGSSVWSRTGTTLSPTTANDKIEVIGSGTPSIKAEQTGSSGIALQAIASGGGTSGAATFSNNSSSASTIGVTNTGSGNIATFANNTSNVVTITNAGDVSMRNLQANGTLTVGSTVQLANLAGTGSRAVVADGFGTLSTTTLPVSGTYSPTLTTGANVSAGSVNAARYMRVGNQVTVYVEAEVTVSATGTIVFYLTVPVASAMTAATNVIGTGTSNDTTVSNLIVNADHGNDRAFIQANATSTGGSKSVFFTFMYSVL